MAKQVQLRRGDASEHTTFTGAIGELTYVSDDKTLRIHDGATAGGLEVLAGALGGMSIRQIATAPDGGGSHLVTETWVDKASTAFKVFGSKVTIAPKSASSKILLIGNFFTQDVDTSDAHAGADVGSVGYISQDNTAAVGATNNGTLLDQQLFRSTHMGFNTGLAYHQSVDGHIPFFAILDSGSTTSRTYDYVLSRFKSTMDHVVCYPTLIYSCFYAIEIG